MIYQPQISQQSRSNQKIQQKTITKIEEIEQILEQSLPKQNINDQQNHQPSNKIQEYGKNKDNQSEVILKQWKIQQQPLLQQDQRFDKYIQLVKSYGVIIHENIKCGIFALKNGLKYSGLYTNKQLNTPFQSIVDGKIQKTGKQIVLVTIPVQILLTSFKAQNEAKQQLKQIYKQEAFFHEGLIWQVRILVVFLLYSIQKDKQSIWTHMALNFSKDIDIIQFWAHQDLQQFADKSVIKAAIEQRQSFQKQWKSFVRVQQKHTLLQTGSFTYQNYRWIYTHAVSRCFGSYMNSTYFTPFCQFFNHNCVDVSYSCYEQEQYAKLRQQEGSNVEPNMNGQQTNEQIRSISEYSGDSQDYIQQGDFSYDQISTYTIKWCSKIGFNLREKQTKIIKELHQKIANYLYNQLKWKGFGLLYIGQILQKNNIILNQYMAERRKFAKAKQQLEILFYHVGQFKRAIKSYYKSLGSSYVKQKKAVLSESIQKQKQEKAQQKTCQSIQTQFDNYVKTNKPPEKPYKYFAMVCHAGQKFSKNTQVYFEYNRLSNRSLLLCYGFCLQNNKYEHVWVRRSLAKEISQYPDLYNKMIQKGAPIVLNVKLKPYVLNTELIVLQKMERWKKYGNPTNNNSKDFQIIFGIGDLDQQCQIIQRVIDVYEQQMPKYEIKDKKFSKVGKYGLVDLTNSQLGYHEYFTAVYHNEKIKILVLQIELLNKVRKIFTKMLCKKIIIKGNSNILHEVKNIAIQQFGTLNLVRMVWGYLRSLANSIIH